MLSNDKVVKNPYFGSSMLTCSGIVTKEYLRWNINMQITSNMQAIMWSK